MTIGQALEKYLVVFNDGLSPLWSGWCEYLIAFHQGSTVLMFQNQPTHTHIADLQYLLRNHQSVDNLINTVCTEYFHFIHSSYFVQVHNLGALFWRVTAWGLGYQNIAPAKYPACSINSLSFSTLSIHISIYLSSHRNGIYHLSMGVEGEDYTEDIKTLVNFQCCLKFIHYFLNVPNLIQPVTTTLLTLPSSENHLPALQSYSKPSLSHIYRPHVG